MITNDIVNIIHDLSNKHPGHTFSISCKSNLEPKQDKIGEYHVLYKWHVETSICIFLPFGTSINHKIYGSSRHSIEDAVKDLETNLSLHEETLNSGFVNFGSGVFRSVEK